MRRAFLYGHDHHSGQSLEHRRGWIAQRTKALAHWGAHVFAIDVAAYAVIGHHKHVVLRMGRERAQGTGPKLRAGAAALGAAVDRAMAGAALSVASACGPGRGRAAKSPRTSRDLPRAAVGSVVVHAPAQQVAGAPGLIWPLGLPAGHGAQFSSDPLQTPRNAVQAAMARVRPPP